MIDLNHTNATSQSLSQTISALVDQAMVDDEGPGRRYLGASALGHECERAIQLDFIRSNQLPGAPEPCEGFSGRTLRIFGTGHVLEQLAAGWLQKAGFDLSLNNPGGGQHGFSTANGRFAGHADGVILGAPIDMAVPALWEHKGLNNKGWQELIKKGLKSAKPMYAAQIALYQAYLYLETPALFHATNKDTSEMYFELVPFDGDLAQRTSDKAVRIIQATDAGDLQPKCSTTADYFTCKWCRWREFCWA